MEKIHTTKHINNVPSKKNKESCGRSTLNKAKQIGEGVP
jgi:hypothetical protein